MPPTQIRYPLPIVGNPAHSWEGMELLGNAGEQVMAPENGWILYSWDGVTTPIVLGGRNFSDTGQTPEYPDVPTDLPGPSGVVIAGASGAFHLIAGMQSSEWGPIHTRQMTPTVAQRFSMPLDPAYRGEASGGKNTLMAASPVKAGERIGRVSPRELVLWRVQLDPYEARTGVDPEEWIAQQKATAGVAASSGPSGLAIGVAVWLLSKSRKRRARSR